jgi:hypothetical protein
MHGARIPPPKNSERLQELIRGKTPLRPKGGCVLRSGLNLR